jgi:RimJ/RimL family protein N-acetyltransferase
MIYKEKKVLLRNGKTVVLKSPSEDDWQAMIDYIKCVSAETPYILRTPEECKDTEESEKAFIRRYNESELECMIAVFDGETVVGNCNLNVKNRKKVRHRAELGIGLCKSHYRLGIGTTLITELSIIARNEGCTQFELQYVDGNYRAKGLYEKCGFVEVGRMPCGVRFDDGTYADDVNMRKIL